MNRRDRRTLGLFTALVLSMTALAPVTAAYAVNPESSDGVQTTRYIVQFVDGTDINEQVRNARSNGLGVGRVYTHVFPGLVAEMTPGQAEAFSRRPDVVVVEPDAVVKTTGTQTAPVWGLDRIDQRVLPLSGSYDYTDVNGVDVYVVDTGIRADHSEFAGRVGTGFTSIADGNGTSDCNGHGTHVAGTVAGTTYGVAKTARVVPVRVLGCAGSGTNSSVVAGLDWVVAHHVAGVPAVANMSLGGGISSTIDNATLKVINDGVTVVVAAGNSNVDACTSSPARVAAAITVGASDSSDVKASFSNYGSCVDLFAPGVGVQSASPASTSATATYSGTSMAAPHVAGAAAILLAGSTLSPAQVSSSINANASAAVTGGGAGTTNRLLYTASSNTAPAASTPSAPSAVGAKAGKRSALVSWVAGGNGGSQITGNTVKVYENGILAGSVKVAGNVTATTVTGLRSGRSYSFGVIATNAVGSSPESTRSNNVVAG